MDFRFAWPFLIPIIAIIGGCTVAIVGTIARAKVREAEIRERIALIEKGLMPPPEVDPRGFDRAMDRFDDRLRHYGRYHRPGKQRRGGIVLLGVGVGLMVMFRVTGETDGVGIGGFLAVLGIAFIISSLFDDSRRLQPGPQQPGWAPPPAPGSSHQTSAPPPADPR